MMKTASRMMLAAATASLAIAPIAAQAGTRAGDRTAVYAPSSAPGVGRAAKGESISKTASLLLALLAAGGIVAGIIVAADTESSDDQSPGT